jgi:hypothetical protein
MVVVIGQIYGARARSATRFAPPPYRQMRLVGARKIARFGPVIKRSSMLFAENTGRCAARTGWNRTASDPPVQTAPIVLSSVLSNLGHSLAES